MTVNYRKITKILLVVVAAVLIIYDFFPFFSGKRGDTISEVIQYYALHCFTLPFVFGTLMAHFFWPRNGTIRPKVLLSLLGLSICLDVLSYTLDIGVLLKAHAYPMIAFCVGIPVGVLFWPEKRPE